MYARVRLYSTKEGEIYNFLASYLGDENKSNFPEIYCNSLEWENIYQNPIDIVTIIGVFVENIEKYSLTMWVSFDKDIFINITNVNADTIIRYLYERYPY